MIFDGILSLLRRLPQGPFNRVAQRRRLSGSGEATAGRKASDARREGAQACRAAGLVLSAGTAATPRYAQIRLKAGLCRPDMP